MSCIDVTLGVTGMPVAVGTIVLQTRVAGDTAVTVDVHVEVVLADTAQVLGLASTGALERPCVRSGLIGVVGTLGDARQDRVVVRAVDGEDHVPVRGVDRLVGQVELETAVADTGRVLRQGSLSGGEEGGVLAPDRVDGVLVEEVERRSHLAAEEGSVDTGVGRVDVLPGKGVIDPGGLGQGNRLGIVG